MVAPDRERVIETDLDLVTDTVPDRVKGRVVGIPDRVTEIVGERVKGRVVGIPDSVLETVPEREIVRDFVLDTDTVGERVA